MSTKLKALGLSLIAALAVSSVVVMNASATDGAGHFVSEGNSSVRVHGEDEVTDRTQFTGAATVECHTATYEANTTSETTTSLTVTPKYENCTSSFGNSTVNMNGCKYTFTVRTPVEEVHSTVHLHCVNPLDGKTTTAKGPEIVTPTCTITITPNQTPSGGVTYTTGGSGNTHDITVDVTVSGLHATYSPAGSFGCAFQSTTATASMHGSATVKGFVGQNQVGITAT